MISLIKNEVKLFLDKKNIICFLIGILMIPLIYQFYYIKEYKKYPQVRQMELQENQKDIDIYTEQYRFYFEQLNEKSPGHKETKEAQLMANIWTNYRSSMESLRMYWEWPERYKQEIRDIEQKMDEDLFSVFEKKIETGDTNLYRNTERDWKQRIKLLEAYHQANQEIPINKKIPTGTYVLNDALSGMSIVFLLMVILVILWNCDSWTADFEQSTYKILFTLPYARKTIFFTRFFVRCILSMFGICILLAVLLIRASIQFGLGMHEYIIINTKPTKLVGFFESTWKALMENDKAVSIMYSIVWSAVLCVLFLFFIMAIIHFISFFIKNQLGTLILITVFMISVITYVLFPKTDFFVGFNVFLYFQSGNALTGALGIGIPLMLLLLLVCSSIVLAVTMFWVEKKEL